MACGRGFDSPRLHQSRQTTANERSLAVDLFGESLMSKLRVHGVARGFNNIGAWILGRNMFGPVRGAWPDENWKGW